MQARLTAINENEVLKYLGYAGGEIPADVTACIHAGMERIVRTARPRACWRTFTLQKEGTTLAMQEAALALPGADIQKLLQDCRQCVILCATLGMEVESLLRRTQLTDLTQAVVLDACASSAIENVCDHIQEDVAADYPAYHLTDRFSPGYGDMPITVQPQLCAAMDTARQIGLTVSQSGILIPRKSVTAIIGLADVPQTLRFRGCEHCRLFKTCNLRKEGKSCGKETV